MLFEVGAYCWKEPSSALRAPSPIASQREKGNEGVHSQVTVLFPERSTGGPSRNTPPHNCGRGLAATGFGAMSGQLTAYSPKASAPWLLMSCKGPAKPPSVVLCRRA